MSTYRVTVHREEEIRRFDVGGSPSADGQPIVYLAEGDEIR